MPRPSLPPLFHAHKARASKTAIILTIVFALLLSACTAPSSTTPTATPTLTKAPPSPTPSQTALPTQTPTPTPVPLALTFWADPSLPDDVRHQVSLPPGGSWVDKRDQATFILVPKANNADGKVLAETVWTYALVAPFLTVQDGVDSIDLQTTLSGKVQEGAGLPVPNLLVREGDTTALFQMLGVSPSGTDSASMLQSVPGDYFQQASYPEDPAWAIVPFDQLTPTWKVLSVDGVSPLDIPYTPETYALQQTYQLQLNDTVTQPLDENLKVQLAGALPAPNRDQAHLTSLVMTGVTAMTRDTAFAMYTEGVTYPATEIGGVLSSADLTHISNEVSFFEDCPIPNPDYAGFIFCSDPAYMELLKAVGADIIELTGNHNNDVRALYKVDSVPYTLDLYRKNGMQWYAGGTDLASAQAPLLIENKGNKLAFIGCNSYGPDMAWARENSSGAAPCGDFVWLMDSIRDLKAQGYLPIVTFQYQEDYYRTATSSAKHDFRMVADSGAVIVNGSQSHVSKVMEFYGGALVTYGLGNLFFDQPGYYITYPSIIQRHFFYNNKHISTQLITIVVEETAKPRLMTDIERQAFLEELFTESEALRRAQ